MQVDGRFEFATARHAAVSRLAPPSDLIVCKAGPDEADAQRVGPENRPSRNQIENGYVRPVAVRDQDSVEAVVRHALCDVEVFLLHIDRAREVHVVGFESVRDQKEQQNVSVRVLCSLLADAPDQEIICVKRQVITVVLNGADRQYDYGPLLDSLAELHPSVVLVEIRSFRHAFNLARAAPGQ